jgi:hypothetical protein
MGGLLTSHGGERCGGVGEGEETAGGDSGSGSPSNLSPTVACSLCISLFLISASVHCKNEYPKVYIEGLGQNKSNGGGIDGIRGLRLQIIGTMQSKFLGDEG